MNIPLTSEAAVKLVELALDHTVHEGLLTQAEADALKAAVRARFAINDAIRKADDIAKRIEADNNKLIKAIDEIDAAQTAYRGVHDVAMGVMEKHLTVLRKHGVVH